MLQVKFHILFIVKVWSLLDSLSDGLTRQQM